MRWNLPWAGTVVGLLLSAAAPYASAEQTDRPADVRQLSRLAESACPNEWRSETLMQKAWQLAGAGYLHRPGCPPNRDLAQRIAEAVAAAESADSDDAYWLLSWLATRGVPADAARAREYSRRAWLLGRQPDMAEGVDPPFADNAERIAYLSQAETIAFLRDYRSSDLVPVRTHLALALIVRDAPGDRAEAAALLRARDLEQDDTARALRLRLSAEEASDAAARAAAIAELRRLSGLDRGARIVLSGIALRQLAAASHPDERLDALEWLGALAVDQDPSFTTDFHNALIAVSGGQPSASLTGPPSEAARQQLRIDPAGIDYPSSALRNEDQGTVRLRGLIDPRGRLIFTEAIEPAPALSLVSALRRAYLRRPPGPIDLGEARTAPFMWIELPPVHFRIPQD